MNELQKFASYRHLSNEQALFRQGELASAIFMVETERVKLVRYLNSGTEVCLHVARAGESFAESALFSETYHCDAIAEIPSCIAVYPKQVVLQLLESRPEFALNFTARLTKQIQSLRTQLELRDIHSARDRTLQYLILLTEPRQPTPKQPTIMFDRPLKDVASDIGLTHEAFYRALAQLEQEGYIKRNRRQITLLNPEI